jgi:meso-butanediol dehydrogenase/(S,S)-butanediol dehydrogenase/diacetyl reductase
VTRLTRKVVVVTGASRGLGFRICEAALAEGARVAMLARDAEVVTKAASRLAGTADGADGMILPLSCDVGDPAAVAAAFDRIGSVWGGADVLVNNAAVGQLISVETAPVEQMESELRINLLGPLLCARAVIPLLRGRGGGDIVNVSSESVRRPYPLLGLYAAAKSALETFSAALRTELRADGIRVMVLRPGRMGESGFNRGWSPEGMARYRQLVAAGGFHAESGEPVPPALVAKSLLDALCLPRAVAVDLLEVRPS